MGRGTRRGAGRAAAAGGAVLLGLACLYLAALGGGAPPLAPPPIGGAFALTAGDGRAVTDRSFGSRWLLIFFGYTACPDECPVALASVADAMTRLGPRADRVQPLFITVDPVRDTPEVVRRYVAAFTPRLVGLTGTPAQIRAVSARYDVRAEVERGAGGERVSHGAVLLLMDPAGRFAAAIAADAARSGMAGTGAAGGRNGTGL